MSALMYHSGSFEVANYTEIGIAINASGTFQVLRKNKKRDWGSKDDYFSNI